MPLAGIVTLIGIGLTVAALAFYLIHVIILLRQTSFALGTIVAGLRSIAHATTPLGPVLTEVNTDLQATRDALEAVLGMELTGTYAGQENEPISA
jgi:hypothetical protein